jgi:hypothetical protein
MENVAMRTKIKNDISNTKPNDTLEIPQKKEQAKPKMSRGKK